MKRKPLSVRAANLIAPASSLAPVEPDDSRDLPEGPTRSLYVAGGGVLTVRDLQGRDVQLTSTNAQYHPIQVQRVLSTGTTATGIIALY
jgi:hypothetical protein